MFENRPSDHPQPSQASQLKIASAATDRIAGLTMEAAKLGGQGNVGRALRLLSESVKLADQTVWPDLEGQLLRVHCREMAARVAHSSGDRIEALQIIDDIIRLQREMLGASDKRLHQSKGWRADLLIELGRYEDAEAAFSEIHEWATSARGTPLAAIASSLGRARAVLLQNRNEECTEAVADAVAELEHVPQARYGALARNLHAEAQSFAEMSSFGLAYQLATLASNYLANAGKEADRDLITEFSLYQADLAGRWGDFNEAKDLRLAVLRRLGEQHDPSHPECMRVRGLMASAALESGRFREAEDLLNENVSLAKRDPEALDYEAHLKALRDFYLETARWEVAGRVAGSLSSYQKAAAEAQLSAAAEEEGSSPTAPTAERQGEGTEISYQTRMLAEAGAFLRSAELLSKMEGSDRVAAEALDKVYEITMDLPAETASHILERAEILRASLARTTEEILAVVRAKEQGLAEFCARFGRSRKLTFAGKQAELAELYFRAGDPRTARVAMRDARATLQECGLKRSALYGTFLIRNASFFRKGSEIGEKMRKAGEELVRRNRS